MDWVSGAYATELWLANHDALGTASRLQEAVWEELHWEPELEACALQVYVTDRHVTLTGGVPRYGHKATAERAACRVPGVAAVTNDIQVELQPADRRADHEIAEEIGRVLAWDTLVPTEHLRFEVKDGVVMLSGQVDREHQRTAAEQVIEPLVGIVGLVNRITVRPVRGRTELTQVVTAAVRHVPVPHVHVGTLGGGVELRGRVRSLAERQQVERAVREVPGVNLVEDYIRIEA